MTAVMEPQTAPTGTDSPVGHYVCVACYPGPRAAWAGKVVVGMCGKVYVAADKAPEQSCIVCISLDLPMFCSDMHVVGTRTE